MLCKIKKPSQYKHVYREGYRFNTPNLIFHVAKRSDFNPACFGVVVSKAVGNAVVRNLMKRRIFGSLHELEAQTLNNIDMVIRVKPHAAKASYSAIRDEIARALTRNLRDA